MTVQIAPPQQEQSPTGGYAIAISVVGICGLIITAILAKTWSTAGSHGSVLYISGIGSILGVIVGAATYVRWENAKGDRRIEKNQQTLATELADVKVAVTTVAAAVTRLAEARSIDLSDARQALREIAGEIQEQTLLGQVMVAEKFSTKLADQAHVTSAAAVEELAKRMDELGAKFDSVQRDAADSAGELGQRFKDLEADLASFRLAQQAQSEQAKTDANRQGTVLRALPRHPD